MQVYLQDTFTIAELLGQKLHMFIILITAVQLPYIGIELTFYFSCLFFFGFETTFISPHIYLPLLHVNAQYRKQTLAFFFTFLSIPGNVCF